MPDNVCLKYCLSREERLVPHLKLWGPMGPLLVVLLLASVILAWCFSSWFWCAVLCCAWLSRGFVYGLVDVWMKPVREMDVELQSLGIGVLCGNERWYSHLDSVLMLEQYVDGLWTIWHSNGSVVNIPDAVMPPEYLEHIRETMSQGWDYLQPFADEHQRKMEQR